MAEDLPPRPSLREKFLSWQKEFRHYYVLRHHPTAILLVSITNIVRFVSRKFGFVKVDGVWLCFIRRLVMFTTVKQKRKPDYRERPSVAYTHKCYFQMLFSRNPTNLCRATAFIQVREKPTKANVSYPVSGNVCVFLAHSTPQHTYTHTWSYPAFIFGGEVSFWYKTIR